MNTSSTSVHEIISALS